MVFLPIILNLLLTLAQKASAENCPLPNPTETGLTPKTEVTDEIPDTETQTFTCSETGDDHSLTCMNGVFTENNQKVILNMFCKSCRHFHNNSS